MVPTSLPGGRPRGMVRVSPRMPREAMWSRFGVRAYSSGVFPPSSAIGSSAIPSPCSTTYFIDPRSSPARARRPAGRGRRERGAGAPRLRTPCRGPLAPAPGGGAPGRRARRLVAHHARRPLDHARGAVLRVTLPVGRDVARVADRQEMVVGRAAERVADLEGRGLLALDAVRVDGVHECQPRGMALLHVA